MQKGTSWDEATLSSENNNPIALAIIELHLSEGIRQAGSQSLKIPLNIFFYKVCTNLLEALRAILRALMGLIIPAKVPG